MSENYHSACDSDTLKYAKLLIITERTSDLSETLKTCASADILSQSEALKCDISAYDCYALLGGTNEKGTVMDVRLRDMLEKECDKGKRIFSEFVNSFRYIYSESPSVINHQRLIAVNTEIGLEIGDLADDENNNYMKPYFVMPETTPLLVYHDYIVAHSKTELTVSEIEKGNTAMWKVGDNLLFSAFRLCDFNKARFAPRKNWEKIITYICVWLTGATPILPQPICTFKTNVSEADFEKNSEEAVAGGISMLKRLLVNDGNGGIKEGLSHHIKADGTQLTADSVRTDCTGEACGAFGMYGELFGDYSAKEIYERLKSIVFGPMMIKGGMFDGMLRWTDTAWGVCYQDDAARAVLPVLYKNDLTGAKENLGEICRICDFLVSTTSADGTRVLRTDCINIKNSEDLKSLKNAEKGYPCAHYNAYYHAMLLLAYKQTGKAQYLDVAKKGLETLMNIYPETLREQSETEELCRLILPLSLLYDVTKDANHKAMLYRVAKDLQKHEHKSGGYSEWDTGYKANCSRNSSGECSLLASNGDPIADLLYSVNWLPIGFAYAYKVTGDTMFYEKWKRICNFFIKCQIHCPGNITDGAWCRAFDMESCEVYGVPHDVGWGPNAVESGWTVSEILMGFMIMKYIHKG